MKITPVVLLLFALSAIEGQILHHDSQYRRAAAALGQIYRQRWAAGHTLTKERSRMMTPLLIEKTRFNVPLMMSAASTFLADLNGCNP
ncbi:hypothetical protein [Fodinicurvata sp. EGI_FJ10296]|uniref:hypothetical protein n=1 Tax=Fodinicurvata sp. EGI_FJ10296 TaxID=3231908 RepID=UPI0034529BAE